MYFIFVYKRDFDIHAKHQISLCVYIYEYMNVLVLVFICIHFTTSIFFYVPHDPQSLLPQPNHWHIQASTVPRSDGLRLFSAPSKEFGTPNEGNGGRKGRGGLGSTAASEEQGLQNTALKVSLVFFFFRWVIKKVVKLQCHYTHVVSSTFFLFGNKFLGPQCLNSLVS